MTSTYYQEYTRKIEALARDYFPIPEDAEDATQEVFAKLISMHGKHPEGEAEAPWVYTVANNLLLDLKRKATTAERHAERAAPLPEEMVDYDDPMERASREELAIIFSAKYDCLPDVLRNTFDMRFIEGMSYEAIAEREGVPVGTVASRIHRAKELCRLII